MHSTTGSTVNSSSLNSLEHCIHMQCIPRFEPGNSRLQAPVDTKFIGPEYTADPVLC